MIKSNELLTKAIAVCDEYGIPPKAIVWKSERHPLGHTSFLRFHDNVVTEIKNSSGFVTGYSVNVWLNDCGHTYNTIWRFDYFASNCKGNRLNAINMIIGE